MSVEIQRGKPSLDLSRYELSRDGRPVKLERQPMELLIFFLKRKGQLVTREEIVEKLWGKDTFVDADPSINAAIRKIRAALKDDPDQPKYLETVVGKGYRLIGEIEAVPAPVAEREGGVRRSVPTSAAQPRLLAVVMISIVALLSVLTLLFISNVGGWRERLRGRATPGAIRSLAVLPLENLSHAAEQDYLADGMTEELITDLSKISALRVISRTSVMRFKGTRRSLPEIAHELNVDAVVVGSIQRSGDRVRITAQLIQAPQDKHLWAETYDRDIRDVLALQSDVASAIAMQVKAQITSAETARLSTVRQTDPEAYQLYLQGIYYWYKGTDQSASDSREYFQKAIEKDPGYARAWVGLAFAYNLMGDFSHGKEAARKALALDDTSGEAHAAFAFATWNNDWDWSIAQQEFKRAIELDANNANAHHAYAAYLAALRRHDEARSEMQRALELDPLAPLANTSLGSIYWSSHDFDRAIQQMQRALEIDPNYRDAHFELALVYESLGRYDQALVEFEKYRTLSGDPLAFKAAMAHLYAVQGRRTDALKLLEELKAAHKHGDVRSSEGTLSYNVALVYVGLGDKDHAFQWLQKSYAGHIDDLVEINDDPRVEPLRSDPRFQELLHRVGLPSQ
jgi:TolB-like protein/DNA-binding winged helix-turn-helix (wHTH) protein/cytochrome c-type biogenesis protein CcmH/NrfG